MSSGENPSQQELEVRLRQHQAIAELGEVALWKPGLQELFDEASRRLADLLSADLTKVMEWHPEKRVLLLRSGMGWQEGTVGTATEPDRLGSAGGYTLLAGEPVLIPDLATEERFAPSALLRDHHAVSGLAVVIRGADRPYGVLAAFTRERCTFTACDVHFVQAMANVLAATLQRVNSEEEQRRSEMKFREMADGLPIMVWMHRATGEQELVNQTMCDYFGLPREELTGERWQTLVHPEDIDAYRHEFLASLRERRPFYAEARVRRADGQWRLLESRGKPRFSDTGEFQGLVGGSLDVTEQRQAEEELRLANHRKTEFIALLGHELRNPLTPIANTARLLEIQRDCIGREQLDELAAVLSRQSGHLTRIVNDLLDLSRMERGRITLQTETVDLRELVSQAVESITSPDDDEAPAFATALPDTPLTVEGDRVRLTQVLNNLLDNAARHTQPGKEIRLEATRDGNEVVVRVRDQGTGIEAGLLSALFEPFERGPDRDSSVMGLGLGLPLVKRLTEMHDGTVEAYSPGPGRGSTFTLRLPASAACEPAAQPEATASEPRATSGEILLVEDHDDVATAMRMVLEALGLEVRRAASGQQAIEASQERRPAAVLIDIGLPDMTGFQLAARIREILQATPLVALSGHAANSFSDGLTEVFDDYLLKPPTTEDLRRALAQLFRR